MSRKSIYPPDDGKDPFVYDGTRSSAVAEAIVGRFTGGDSVPDLALDYGVLHFDVERIIRWWICRTKARVRT